jgi:hypothetical protein
MVKAGGMRAGVGLGGAGGVGGGMELLYLSSSPSIVVLGCLNKLKVKWDAIL